MGFSQQRVKVINLIKLFRCECVKLDSEKQILIYRKIYMIQVYILASIDELLAGCMERRKLILENILCKTCHINILKYVIFGGATICRTPKSPYLVISCLKILEIT